MALLAGLHSIHRRFMARKNGDCVEECMAKCEKKHMMTLSRFDHMMIGIAILYPLTMLPQIIMIHGAQDVSSISSLTLSLKILFVIPWFIYGVCHKSVPIICANVLWFLAYVVILGQIFLYSV